MITRAPASELSTRPAGVRWNAAAFLGPSPRPNKEMISPGERGLSRRLAPFARDVMTGTGLVIGAGAAEIVSVTAMFWEEPVAPVLVAISIAPEYVPASN